MPHAFDTDHYLSLTPRQRDAIIRRLLRQAELDRAEAMRELFRAFGRGFRKAVGWGFTLLRPVWAGAQRLAVAAWRRYDHGRRLRSTAAQLYAMDDRELKDIGLSRGEIGFVLSGVKDPTRRPRTALPTVLGSAGYSSPRRQPPQRPGAPLLLRKECA